MNRTALILLAVALLAPVATATTFSGFLVAGYPQPGIPSAVAVQVSDVYTIPAGPGQTISATLTWPPADANNDLDLVLLWPSAAPVPVNTDDPAGTALGIVNSRVARQTCADMAAKSVAHSGSTETLTFTVPAGGESGGYTLNVRGWVLMTSQGYFLDVTAPGTITRPTANTAFITTAPHCQL